MTKHAQRREEERLARLAARRDGFYAIPGLYTSAGDQDAGPAVISNDIVNATTTHSDSDSDVAPPPSGHSNKSITTSTAAMDSPTGSMGETPEDIEAAAAMRALMSFASFAVNLPTRNPEEDDNQSSVSEEEEENNDLHTKAGRRPKKRSKFYEDQYNTTPPLTSDEDDDNVDVWEEEDWEWNGDQHNPKFFEQCADGTISSDDDDPDAPRQQNALGEFLRRKIPKNERPLINGHHPPADPDVRVPSFLVKSMAPHQLEGL